MTRIIDFLSEESSHLIKFLTDPYVGVFETLDNVTKTLRRFIYDTVTSVATGETQYSLYRATQYNATRTTLLRR